MKIRFQGVRGSIPTPGPETVLFGGNTPCVEVFCGPRRLILDAGSGLRAVAAALDRIGAPSDLDLLLSHTHYDHICGLPFFTPLFRAENSVRIWSGHLPPGGTEAALRSSLTPPLMPDLASLIRARVAYRDFAAGDTLDFGDGIVVRTALLPHPGGCIGYRIEWAGRAMVYATDTVHGDPASDARLRALCHRADVLIYDAMLTDAEFVTRKHWGHSTWQEGVRVAEESEVRQLVLFHHAPSRDDTALAELEAQAAALRPGTIAAREGQELTPGLK